MQVGFVGYLAEEMSARKAILDCEGRRPVILHITPLWMVSKMSDFAPSDQGTKLDMAVYWKRPCRMNMQFLGARPP